MSAMVLDLLKNTIEDLTATQRKVADYVLKNPSEVAFMTTEQLSALTGVSVASIMRLAYSMGYTGYSQFQKDLQDLLKGRVAPPIRFATTASNLEKKTLLETCAQIQINNINETAQFLVDDVVKNAIKLVNNAKKIYLLGIRSSHATAYYLYEGLNRIGLNCELLLPDTSRTQSVLAHMSGENLLIAISLPRYAKRTVEIVKTAKKKQAKILAITDGYSSPLAIIADEFLPCAHASASFHNSAIGSIFLADFLISGLAAKNKEKAKKSLSNIESIVEELDANACKD